MWFIFAFFSARECSAKHTGPVWQLKWVEWDIGTREGNKRERLISISADGRITQWFIQEGLGCIGKHFPCTKLIPDITITSFIYFM